MIARSVGVSSDPVPGDLVLRGEPVEFLPQIDILDRLSIRSSPAIALPDVNPALDAVFDVLRVGIDGDRASPLQARQRPDDRGELHAVVGRLGFTPRQLTLVTV